MAESRISDSTLSKSDHEHALVFFYFTSTSDHERAAVFSLLDVSDFEFAPAFFHFTRLTMNSRLSFSEIEIAIAARTASNSRIE
jgi:hypothetical protein